MRLQQLKYKLEIQTDIDLQYINVLTALYSYWSDLAVASAMVAFYLHKLILIV